MLESSIRGKQQTAITASGDFAARLLELGVQSERNDIWLMVGKPTHAASWKLHVSATVAGVDVLFERVLPYLARRAAVFKIAAGRDEIILLGAGNFGETQIGKIVTIYPRSDVEAVALAHDLIELTHGMIGPEITTDLHLGASVYARYGAVCPQIRYDRFGQPTELIPDGSGNWIPDLRPVPFSCPPAIINPFPRPAIDAATSLSAKRALLGGRYFVTDVLRPGLAGSVFRAIDVRHKTRPAACVLKQARPHCAVDEFGRDRRVRLKHEAAILARLRGLAGVASAGGYFEVENVGYLPVAYVPGKSLAELVYHVVADRSWASLRARFRQQLLRYAIQLVCRLRAAHFRGVVHRDVAPGNVWIGANDRVYLLDWECAHAVGSRKPPFRFGTPGYSELSWRARVPTRQDDWNACVRVIAFLLTGLDPAVFLQGQPRELAARLMVLTGLPDSDLIQLLAHALADEHSEELSASKLLAALDSPSKHRSSRRIGTGQPLFTSHAYESVLEEGLEHLAAKLRLTIEQLSARRSGLEASTIDAHGGMAGLLYVLAAAHSARVAHLETALAERAARVLTARALVTPNLPGLVHGNAGRALAVAAAVQAGCVSVDHALYSALADALDGRLDWPDFTHGAAGQGFAALACARRLATPYLAHSAAACADFLVRMQAADGAWTLPEGCAASGERYTGFAHGAAGMMAFLGNYAAYANDAVAGTAWRRTEAWLVRQARRGRGGKWQWPHSESDLTPAYRWCHGAPGIALGWLCVARAQGLAAISQDHLHGALDAIPHPLRSECLGFCHGLAGVGEVYLEAHLVIGEEQWRERATDIAQVLVALFRGRSRQPWHYLSDEPAAEADGLMLGTAGILHFLLRHRYSSALTGAPLLY